MASREETLLKQVEELTLAVREQQADLVRLTEFPRSQATVVAVKEETVLLESGNGGKVEVPLPVRDKALAKQILPGTLVTLNKMSQIVAVSAFPNQGILASITRVIDPKTFEIDSPNGRMTIDSNGIKASAGDEFLISKGFGTIIRAIEKQEKVVISEPVTWDSIGGNVLAKNQLKEAIQWPVKYKNLYTRLGKKPMKGILLDGPPGNGKTMLAKAAASELSSLHGSKGITGFFAVKGPEVLSKWVGEGEAQVRRLFSLARKQAAANGFPSVIFIDEADSLLNKRHDGRATPTDTIVNQFLVEMDGIETTNSLVILATNRPDMLDEAVVREGRVDRKIHVPRPSEEDAKEILKVYLKNLPFESDLTLNSAISCIVPAIYNKIPHKVSGALLANLVDRSTSFTIERATKTTKPLVGISHSDISNAIAAVCN